MAMSNPASSPAAVMAPDLSGALLAI